MSDPVVGWLVLVNNGSLGWQDDWDGEVHKTVASAQLSLKLCREANYECMLVAAIKSKHDS